MKPFSLQVLTELIASIPRGKADVSRGLAKFGPLQKQLWLLVFKQGGQCDGAFKETVFHKIFDKGMAYDEKKMDELLDGLHHYLDIFFKANQTNTAAGQKIIADTLRKHCHDKQADKAVRKSLRLAEQEPETTQHFIKFAINKQKYKSNKRKNKDKQKVSRQERHYLEAIDDLDDAIDELTILRSQKKKTGAALFKKIETIKSNLPTEPTPLIAIMLQAAEYFLKPGIASYQAFKTIYFDKVDLLNSMADDLLYSLINALIVFPQLPQKIRPDYTLLYRFGMDRGLFVKQGKIGADVFDNIIYTSQSLGDFKLLNEAIRLYKDMIQGEKEKDNERSLSMARAFMNYGDGNYDVALVTLEKLDKDSHLAYYHVPRKYILGFKCAYERATDKQDTIVYMDFKDVSYRGMLGSYGGKYISLDEKQNYRNFFDLLYKICNRNDPENTKKNLEALLESYNGAILELKWLKEKIAELEG